MLFTTSLSVDLLLTFCGLFVLIYLYTSRNYNYWKKRGVPYVKPFPFCGSFPEIFTLRKSIVLVYRDLYLKTNDPYVGVYLLDKPHLLMRDRNLIKSVLMEGSGHFLDRNVVTRGTHDTLSSSMLFFMPSPDWGKYRKKMTPVFTSGKLKTMYGHFEEVANGLVKYLAEKKNSTDILDFKEVSSRYTIQIITSTAFGLDANSFSEGESDFFKAGTKVIDYTNISRAMAISCYMFLPTLVDLFRIMLVDPESASFFRYAFWKTFKQREETNSKRNDLIDILIQMRNSGILENEGKNGDKILAQAVVFFLAGFETTSTAISFALYELAKNPEIQTKVRTELQDIVKAHGQLNYDLLTGESSEYLTMVVKETLRKYPSIPFLDRKCNKDFPLPGTNLVIEKGVGVYISVLGIHNDPENFPNPEKFDPERFTEENIKKIKPNTYLPFGDGPRNCIGMRFAVLSTKNALANIILNFEVEFCESTPKTVELNRLAPTLATLDYKMVLKYKKLKQTQL